MWKLIKAEIAYYRRSIVMMYLLIFPVTIAYVYFGGKEVSELLLDKWLVMGIWMMFLAALILYGFTKVESIRHKRDRYLSLLPLQHIRSGRKSKKLIIAIAVILIQVLFWPYFLTLYSYYNVKPFNFLKNDIPTFLLSHTSAIISAFAGLVCVGLSVVIFVKQKSYLE